MAIEAVIFDVFGTLVDWRESVAEQIGEAFARKEIAVDPHEIADAWRGEYQPAMERIRSGRRGYVPLDDLHLENLEIVLQRFGLSERFNDSDRNELNRSWERLTPWPDVRPGLQKMHETRILAACSNGSIALIARLARFAEIPFDAILGAEIAKSYKPKPEVYLESAAALRLVPAQVLMVAAHNDDLRAAAACGLATAFVPRATEHGPGQTTDLRPDGEWNLVARDMVDLSEMQAG